MAARSSDWEERAGKGLSQFDQDQGAEPVFSFSVPGTWPPHFHTHRVPDCDPLETGITPAISQLLGLGETEGWSSKHILLFGLRGNPQRKPF